MSRETSAERAALVGLINARKGEDSDWTMNELASLAEAAGAVVAMRLVQERATPDPSTYIGSGKLKTLDAAAREAEIDVVIVDGELTPAQLSRLERTLDRKVIDRTQLILDIFSRRARTREGKWQVELAQLEYLLPRLAGSGTALSRLGGGIGTRGPGETKLEVDRRRVRARIQAIQREIDQVRRRRLRLRERRHKRSIPTVALVGYTNAGKTTLFNRITDASAVTSDALFVTLDPLVRQLQLTERGAVLVSDTVGFIDRLPHALVAAFRATLEEVAEADLVLHVIDGSDGERERRIAAVHRVLAEMGAADVPRIEVYSKSDLMSRDEQRRVKMMSPAVALVSARTGRGISVLLKAIASRLAMDAQRMTMTFDDHNDLDKSRISHIYQVARVIRHVARNGRVVIEADVPRRFMDRLATGRRPATAREEAL